MLSGVAQHFARSSPIKEAPSGLKKINHRGCDPTPSKVNGETPIGFNGLWVMLVISKAQISSLCSQ